MSADVIPLHHQAHNPSHTLLPPCSQTCATNAFCNRLRGVPSANYTAIASSGRLHNGIFSFQVKDDGAGYILALEVYAPKEGIVAIRGAELDSSHRFRVPHILTEQAESDVTVPLVLTERKGMWELVHGTLYKVVIQRDPFLLTVWAGNTIQATLNGRKLFTIEHLRNKQVLKKL